MKHYQGNVSRLELSSLEGQSSETVSLHSPSGAVLTREWYSNLDRYFKDVSKLLKQACSEHSPLALKLAYSQTLIRCANAV